MVKLSTVTVGNLTCCTVWLNTYNCDCVNTTDFNGMP